jgi:hypothetical protein
MQEGTIAIKGDTLVIMPVNAAAYIFMRVSFTDTDVKFRAKGKKNAGYGSGCDVAQCHGITKKGRRCLKRTSDCSGYCYYHK